MAKKQSQNGHTQETPITMARRFGRGGYIPIRIVNDQTTLSRSAIIAAVNGVLPDLEIDKECRYPTDLTVKDHYQPMYERNDVARRVVAVHADESWQIAPDIYETEDLENETEFEKQWQIMNDSLHILTHLQTLDEISGIGEYGVMLLGFNDRNSSRPELSVPGVRADGLARDNRFGDVTLQYVRTISQQYVKVLELENNPSNPRFGQPTLYEVTFAAPDAVNTGGSEKIKATKDVKIHWTRVLHVADNRKDSPFLGVPRQRPVYNRLLDIKKILGANAQGYWTNGFPGLSVETQPGIEATEFDDLAKEKTREEVSKFRSGLQRDLLLDGLTAKQLAALIADPRPHFETHIAAICVAIDVPMRIFKGSEEAKLASSQDQRTWNKRLSKRQTYYITPFVVMPFFERMFLVGALPRPKQLIIKWADLNAPTENDRATTAQKITESLFKYITGNIFLLMGPKEYLVLVLGYPTAQVDSILKSVGKEKLDMLMKLAKAALQPKGPEQKPRSGRTKKPGATEGAGPNR